MAFVQGFWVVGATGTVVNMNNCLLGWGPYADFPAPAAYVSVDSPGNAGMLAFATDRNTIYKSSGTTWDAVAIAPPASLVTGDLIAWNGLTWVRIAGGTSGYVLTSQGAGVLPIYTANPVPSGIIAMWSGLIANIPSGWLICDGTNGTPNLLAKFVEGVATAATNPGATGGATAKTTGENDTVFSAYYPGTYVAAAGHVHTISDIRPLYYDIAFIMKS